jgi:D-inositol-3-phosphate glycosyltransferase
MVSRGIPEGSVACRLLVIGDGGAPTGYARVTASILRELPRAEYEIHHLAVNYGGDPHGEAWPLYPASLGGDIFGVNRIKDLCRRIAPNLVFCIADLWIQKRYLEALAACTPVPRTIVYSPVDAGPVDPEWVEGFPRAAKVVAMTEYARQEIQRALPPGGAVAAVIPLGVETGTFYPLESESSGEAKRRLGLLEVSGGQDQPFIVLNANRNQPRKRIDITLKGFARFAAGKPAGVQLYLHMGVEDVGWNVLKLSQRYGIGERLILSEGTRDIPGIATEHLNLVYNACDVGLNTSTGEGWGLPSMEHAATGKAQVLPRFGALAELWSEAAEFLEPTGEVVYEGVLSEGKVVSPETVAEALDRLYADTARRNQVAQACYERTTQPAYDWKVIAKRWHEVFQEVVYG